MSHICVHKVVIILLQPPYVHHTIYYDVHKLNFITNMKYE